MVVKPHLQPRVFGRKKDKRITTVKDLTTREYWKEHWQLESMPPIPMGNPYSRQPFDYFVKSKLWEKKHGKRPVIEPIYAQTSGDRMPDISRRLLTKTLGKGVARLHPVGLAVTLAMDAKDIYRLLK